MAFGIPLPIKYKTETETEQQQFSQEALAIWNKGKYTAV